MIPGVLALVLLVVTANLASMAVVREKGAGHARAVERDAAAPLGADRRQAAALRPDRHGRRAAGRRRRRGMVSDPVAGELRRCCSRCPLIYVFSTLALGLFISTISDTQQQAMMTSTFFFLTPMMYLSGFIFPIENMPQVIQPVTYLIPLRYFLVIVRGIFLKGIGLDLLWPQALAMSAWGTGMLGLAVLRSRKRGCLNRLLPAGQ